MYHIQYNIHVKHSWLKLHFLDQILCFPSLFLYGKSKSQAWSIHFALLVANCLYGLYRRVTAIMSLLCNKNLAHRHRPLHSLYLPQNVKTSKRQNVNDVF